jgi:hypothetical protein
MIPLFYFFAVVTKIKLPNTMKKLILSIALLAGMTFVACSDEDEVLVVNYVGCQECEIPNTAPSEVDEQPYQVCVDADGIAYVDNAYTGVMADYYFELYCANELEIPVGGEPTGSEEPGTATTDCVTCAEYSIAGMPMPAVEVCKGTNGNAFLQDVDTGVYLDQYLTLQRVFTTCD